MKFTITYKSPSGAELFFTTFDAAEVAPWIARMSARGYTEFKVKSRKVKKAPSTEIIDY